MVTTDPYPEQVRLTVADYRLLRSETETYREELLVRLCGEVGLRATEIPAIRPVDVLEEGGGVGHFLIVREDPGDLEREESREAFVPADVANDLFKFIEQNDIDRTEPLVDISPRRIQMLVDEVASRTAEAHNRSDLRDVSPSELRRFFARRLLRENGVDPAVVRAVGGWKRLDTVLADAPSPSREQIVDAFDHVSQDGPQRSAGRLSALIDAVHGVGSVLSEAGSPEEVPELVCDRLAGSEAYRAVRYLEPQHHRDGVTTRASVGDELDRSSTAAMEALVIQVLQTGRLMVAKDQSTGGSAESGRPMRAAVPVVDGEKTYGVLVCTATTADAFEDAERQALSDLGRRIGFAMTSLKRHRLLSENTVVELEVAYDDRDAVFVDLSVAHDCEISLEGLVPAESGAIVTFVRVQSATPGGLLESLQDHESVQDARIIRSFETEALLEVVLVESTPIGIFDGQGGKVVDLTVDSGRARLVGEFPPSFDVRQIVEAVGSEYPSVELRSKQERSEPNDSALAVKRALEEELTDKQRDVLQGAYHSGYFEWPRGSTAEELADSMGVSSPTLHNHLRRAEQKLIGTALDEE